MGDIAITANNEGITALAFQSGSSPLQITDSMSSNPKIFEKVHTQVVV